MKLFDTSVLYIFTISTVNHNHRW